MRISDLLTANSIILGAKPQNKTEAINALIDLHESAGNLTDKEKYREGILAREAQGSTAIGDGIAIPHAKSNAVKKPGLAAVTVPDGVDYEALDGKFVISIVAGWTFDMLKEALPASARFVRVMPNTPAMVGEAMSALCRNEAVSDEEFASVM